MQFFLDFIEENQNLNRLINTVSELPGHQGTVIRFSDKFLNLYSIVKKIPEEDISNIFYSYEEFFRYRYFPFHLNLPFWEDTELVDSSQIGFYEINQFKKLIPDNIDKAIFNPIEVIISIFNNAKKESFQEILNEFRNDDNFKVLIENRGRNTFLNSRKKHNPLIGGISISNNDKNKYGTLGGFLKSKDGEVFGITCSHVASSENEPIFQPAKYDSNNSRQIGEVLHASNLNFCRPHSPCSPNTSQGNMDVTLIQLKEEESYKFGIHKLGNTSKFTKFRDIRQGMKIEFNGRTTNKRKQLTIGGLCVSYNVAYEKNNTTKYACFTNLIELRNTPTSLFGTNYYVQDSPVREGDSGAWICSNDSQGYSWCGMLISGDVDRGYFLSSEHIIQSLENSGFSFDL